MMLSQLTGNPIYGKKVTWYKIYTRITVLILNLKKKSGTSNNRSFRKYGIRAWSLYKGSLSNFNGYKKGVF
jgi:hypothetical protein